MIQQEQFANIATFTITVNQSAYAAPRIQHMPACNCGTGDPPCGEPGTIYSYYSENSELDLDLEKVAYWPKAACSPRADRPAERTGGQQRWREWARVRRHAKHDRAPPVLAV